jgi:adenylate kinase
MDFDNTDSASDSSSVAPSQPTRSNPNILICGTPGTGKTTTSEMVANATGLEHIEVAKWVKERALHEGKDEHWESFILDEDKVCGDCNGPTNCCSYDEAAHEN